MFFFNFKDSQAEKDYFNYHTVKPKVAIQMMFIATTLSFITNLISDIVILNQTSKYWISIILYLASAVIALLAYIITRKLYSLKRVTDIIICLMIWSFFALRYAGNVLNEPSDDDYIFLGNLIANLVFLAVGLLAISSLELRIVHIMGIFALVLGTCITNYQKEASFFIAKALCALVYTGIAIIYSDKNLRNTYLQASALNNEMRRIAQLVPNGAVIINSSKKAVFANDRIEKIFFEEAGALSPITYSLENMYALLDSKFKDLKPLDGHSAFEDSTIPLVDSSLLNFASMIEINLAHPTIDNIVSALLLQEKSIRMLGPVESQRARVIYKAITANHRQYELHFLYTTQKSTGSVLLLIFETTASQENKELKLKNSSHNQSVAYIVHELRTPLGSSLIMLQNVLEFHDVSVEITEKLIKPAISSLKLLMNLVNDILDMAQMSEDKLSLTFLPTSIESVIGDTLKVIDVLANIKNIKISRNISYIPLSFRTDPGRLQQILMNLLSNAIKFTEPGGLITISADVIQTLPCMVEITIEDTGIGIKEEDQKKLFQDFTKISLGDKAHMNASGCGLGLNLANKMAMALARGPEDHMRVRSILGQGTAFTFYLMDKKSRSFRESVDLASDKRKETINDLDHNEAFEENAKPPNENDQSLKIAFVNMSYLAGTKVHSKIKFSSHQDYDIDQLHLQFEPSERESPWKSDRIEVSSPSEQKNFKEPPKGGIKNKQIYEIQKTHKMLRRGESDEFNLLETPESRDLSVITAPADANVLVVDDDRTCLYSLELCIAPLGVKAQYCSSGEEAYELLAKRLEQNSGDPGYRLVFMDRNMQKMDGIETTKKIRGLLVEKNVSNELLVIIGTSALESGENTQELLNAGMNEVVSKPIEKQVINQLFIKYKIIKQE